MGFVVQYIFSHKLAVAAVLICGTWGVLLAELTQIDGSPANHVLQRIAEHGILAMLVAALMWMGWLRENRLAAEAVNREKLFTEHFTERLKLASSMLETRDKFIQDQMMSLITKTHENIASCHHFRGNAMVALDDIRLAKNTSGAKS